jgi:hypothetical protein
MSTVLKMTAQKMEETRKFRKRLNSSQPSLQQKKRLMVFFNFSPENTQELSKLMGDYITVATRHSIPLQQDLMSRDRDLVIYATVAATLRHPDT